MTALELPAGALPGDLHALPSWSPDPAQLDDLELLLGGGYAPLAGYLDAAAAASVRAGGRLPDGRRWPLALRLQVPDDVAAAASPGGRLVLEDPEGVPLAVLAVADAQAAGEGRSLGGTLTPVRPAMHGPFRRLRVPAAQCRAEAGQRRVLAAPTSAPLLGPDLEVLREAAARLDADLLLLPLVGAGTPRVVAADGLLRATLAAADELPVTARTVAVPLPAHAELDEADRSALLVSVAAAYGATHVLLPPDAATPEEDLGAVVVARPPGAATSSLAEVVAGLARGEAPAAGLVPAAAERELRRALRPAHARGVTVFFTGLSGSGKSTIARGLYDALLERGERTLTLLDGDVVRRLLSSGLSFSPADRDLNVRRIGFVAAEITRHGGLVIAAPIAPYARSRAAARAMVEAGGDFVLVHVATPLEVCEQRDRKGLYAKARAGLVPAFTGVSDPYEEPEDADLVVDTTRVGPEDAVARVLALLQDRGHVAPQGQE